MKITLDCPHASYGAGMRIRCAVLGWLCPHQRYKDCKGWWVLTESAARCPKRKVEQDGQKQ